MPLPHEIESVKHLLSHVMPLMVDMQWQFDDAASTEAISLSVRRINLLNAGKEALAILKLDSVFDITPRLLKLWCQAATDVLDPRPGNVVIDVDVFQVDACHEEAAMPCPSSSYKRSVHLPKLSMPGDMRSLCKESSGSLTGVQLNEMLVTQEPEPAARPSLKDEEDAQIAALNLEQQRAIEEIQTAIIRYVTTYHEDPRELLLRLQGIIIIDDKPSPLVVNNDLEIVLSHYDEIVVKMPAMLKAIYILFLLRPEGIVLKNFSDYRQHLEQIYGIVMPGRDMSLAQDALDNLCNPATNTLYEYLSKIKGSFRRYVKNDDLLRQYSITGRPGQPYRITLDRNLVTIPAIFTA